MANTYRALIAGCGYVGTALGESLLSHGHSVWGMRRSTPERSTVSLIRADLTDPALPALPTEIDTVIYTAAPDNSSAESYRRIYVDGVHNLLDALTRSRCPIRRFIYVSSSAVYGQNDGEWVDEESPAEPERMNGKILLEGEAAARGGPFPAIVVRLSGIYGPGRKRMIDAARRAQLEAGISRRFTNRIHRDDCVGMLQHLVALTEPSPLYIGSDSCPAMFSEVVHWIAERMDLPQPVPADDQNVHGITGKKLSNRRILNSGYTLCYPSYREGYEQILTA